MKKQEKDNTKYVVGGGLVVALIAGVFLWQWSNTKSEAKLKEEHKEKVAEFVYGPESDNKRPSKNVLTVAERLSAYEKTPDGKRHEELKWKQNWTEEEKAFMQQQEKLWSPAALLTQIQKEKNEQK